MAWVSMPDQTLHVAAGSSLDLSGLRKTAIPAGSRGRIVIHGSDPTKLAEADAPTTEIRLMVAQWAPDIVSVPLPDSKAQITAGVQHLARKGFNCLRLHGIELWLMAGTTGEFNFPADRLDNLDWLIAECIRLGLYYIIVPRANELYQDGQGCGRFSGFPATSPDLKPRIFTQQNARDHYETGFNLLYNRTNPYTGRNILTDDAVFLVEGWNENSAVQTGQEAWPDVWSTRDAGADQGTAAKTWPEWLADSTQAHGYANIAALNTSWGTAYANFSEIPTPTELPNQSIPATQVSIDMVLYIRYLEDSLATFVSDVLSRSGYAGLRCSLVAFPSLSMLANCARHECNDVVNLHDYTFLAATPQVGDTLTNDAPNNPIWEWESWMYSGATFTSGKPAYLGEYGWPYWGQYRNQYPMHVAYAAYQGAPAVTLFHQGEFFESTYSDAAKARTKKLYPYSGHADPVVIFTEYVNFFAFHMGYVTEATHTETVTVNDRYYGVSPRNANRINRAFYKLFFPPGLVPGVVKQRVDWESDTTDDSLAVTLNATDWFTFMDTLKTGGYLTADNRGYQSASVNRGTITAVETSGTVGSVTASATQPVLTLSAGNTLVTGDQIAITSITGSTGTWPGTSGRGTRAYVKTIGVTNKVQITAGLNLTGLSGFTAGTWCEFANEMESASKELRVSRRQKFACIDAQKLFYFVAAGASGIFPFSHRLGQVRIESITDGAAMFIASLDDTRLMASNAMLIGLVGNSQNTGEAYTGDNREQLAVLGEYPIQIENVSCTFRLTVSEGMTSASDELTLSGDDAGSATVTAIDANTIEVTVTTGNDAAVFWELRRTGGIFRFVPSR